MDYINEAKRYSEEAKAYTEQIQCYIIEIKELLVQVAEGREYVHEATLDSDTRARAMLDRNQAVQNTIEEHLTDVQDLLADLDAEVVELAYQNVLYTMGIN